MQIKYLVSIAAILLILLHPRVIAQTELQPEEQSSEASVDTLYHRIGLFGDFNYNMHLAGFNALPRVPSCCPNYTFGSGAGYSLGGLYQLLFGREFGFTIRVGINERGALLKDLEVKSINLDSVDIDGTVQHTLDTKIPTIGIELLFDYLLAEDFYFSGGGKIDFPLKATFAQKEEIVVPEDRGVFKDTKTRKRNVFNDNIPDLSSIEASLQLGFRYELPLNANRTLMLAPEVYYELGLTNIVSSLSWKPSALRFGVSIFYEIQPYKPEPPMPPPAPALPPPPEQPPVVVEVEKKIPQLDLSVSSVGIVDGKETNVLSIRVEEFISTNMTPLLNYIFFDHNSSQLPTRYVMLDDSMATDFKIEKLRKKPTLYIYYNILNIVGSRMKQYPDSKLTIVGCNSNLDEEQGNTLLSRNRAITAYEYMTRVCKIAPNRLEIKSRNLPEKPSNITKEDGIEENRRVELYSDNYHILAPVIIHDTLTIITKPKVRFYPRVATEAGLQTWSMRLEQSGASLKEITGTTTIPPSIDLDLTDIENINISKTKSLDYILSAVDTTGQSKSSPKGGIPIDLISVSKKQTEQLNDMRIDRYSLILFEFDDPRLTPDNQRIADFIRNNIESSSIVSVSGYTDRIGEEDYNKKLSENRATNTAKAIKQPNAEIRAVGESELLYDNDRPEGRFYCRTVTVIVRTPIQW